MSLFRFLVTGLEGIIFGFIYLIIQRTLTALKAKKRKREEEIEW